MLDGTIGAIGGGTAAAGGMVKLQPGVEDTVGVVVVGTPLPVAWSNSSPASKTPSGFVRRHAAAGGVVRLRAGVEDTVGVVGVGTHLFLFDLHTDGIELYLDDRILSRHVYGAPLITAKIAEKMKGTPFVLGACDAGRAKWVQSLARDLKVQAAFVYERATTAVPPSPASTPT